MMKALANWVLTRRANALAATCGFAVFGLFFPPLLALGLASLALVGLRRGPKEGLLIVVGSTVFMVVLSLVANQGVWLDVVIYAALWLITWGVSQVYRQYASAAWMINAAGLISVILVAGVYLILGNPSEYWLGLLQEYLRPVLLEAQMVQHESELDQILVGASRLMTGGIAGLLSLLVIVSVLLARWWQAMLFNPGGFRQEFHSLRLGRIPAWIMLALLAMSLVGQFAFSRDLATVVWLIFLFQGLAVMHYLVLQLGMSAAWLFGIYFLLALVPYYASPVLSGLGFIDTWFNFRARAQRGKGTNSENNGDEPDDKSDV